VWTHLAPQDMRDAHLVVVDDVGKVIRWETVGLEEDGVVDGRCRHSLSPAKDEVLERQCVWPTLR
jgi:hypothetical protein